MGAALFAGLGVYFMMVSRPVWRIVPTQRRSLPPIEMMAAISAIVLGLVVLRGWYVSAAPMLGVATYVVIKRLDSAIDVHRVEKLRLQIPLVIDLTNAVLTTGAPIDKAIDIASRAVGDPIRAELISFGGRFFINPHAAAQLLSTHEYLGVIGRSLLRTLESGASVTNVLARAGIEARRDVRVEARKKARAVEISTAGPLAACFLPAFMLIAIVPTIMSGFIS